MAPKTSDEALIEQLTTERDRYAVMLLTAEQELAKWSAAEHDDLESCRQAYLLLIDSRSWRLTRPLRIAARLVHTLMRSRSKG